MTQKLGIREIVRNFTILDNYDYIEIVDKKSHKLKGLFVSSEFMDDVKEFIEQKIKEKKEKELNKIIKFAGIASGDTDNMNEKEMREIHAKSKV
ncbi:hypothetical protein [Nitratiruptor sp. SB155-2]|uniref:hypothetical protein n=1 Tax=Nitratiruptor sp. (strain SB155-2) TaxID=387092 RepID=UPI00015873FA|nr:hypothetical protein [Nitratiruptor sp. SB155-2]BAF70497.1 conserved hypothetical protein [Nitratiruptor sp. SB155-2]